VPREASDAKIAPSILAADLRARRTGARGGERGSGSHPRRCDGRPFRSQYLDGAPIVALCGPYEAPDRDAPDDHGPDTFLEEFVDAGSDSFLVHWEGNFNLHRTVHRIVTLGKRVGSRSIRPRPRTFWKRSFPRSTSAGNDGRPGIRHHSFSTPLCRDQNVRRMIDRLNPGCDLEVDGGIDADTARLAVSAGANVLVAGPPCLEIAKARRRE